VNDMATGYFRHKTVTPSFVAFKSGSPRNLGHGFEQVQHRLVENRKILARDKILYHSFLFAERKRFSQAKLEFSVFADEP